MTQKMWQGKKTRQLQGFNVNILSGDCIGLHSSTTEGFKLLIPGNFISGKQGDKDRKEENFSPCKVLLTNRERTQTESVVTKEGN